MINLNKVKVFKVIVMVKLINRLMNWLLKRIRKISYIPKEKIKRKTIMIMINKEMNGVVVMAKMQKGKEIRKMKTLIVKFLLII